MSFTQSNPTPRQSIQRIIVDVFAVLGVLAAIYGGYVAWSAQPSLVATSTMVDYTLPKVLGQQLGDLADWRGRFKIPPEIFGPESFENLERQNQIESLVALAVAKSVPSNDVRRLVQNGHELFLELKNQGNRQAEKITVPISADYIELVDQDGNVTVPQPSGPVSVGTIDPGRKALVRAWKQDAFWHPDIEKLTVSHASGVVAVQSEPGYCEGILSAIGRRFWGPELLLVFGAFIVFVFVVPTCQRWRETYRR